MWNGEFTEELDQLYDEYHKMFGTYPDYYDDIEYGSDEYEEYVRDIKKALREKKELPCVVNYQGDVE